MIIVQKVLEQLTGDLSSAEPLYQIYESNCWNYKEDYSNYEFTIETLYSVTARG